VNDDPAEPPPPLLSAAQLATEFGVTRQAVSNWARRRETNGFPQPADRGLTGHKHGHRTTDLYDLQEVRTWREAYIPAPGNPRLAELNRTLPRRAGRNIRSSGPRFKY
jgi:hypothetical protein